MHEGVGCEQDPPALHGMFRNRQDREVAVTDLVTPIFKALNTHRLKASVKMERL